MYSVTYKELPGTRRGNIEDRIRVFILLLDFYFQTEGIDKIWRLLLKKRDMDNSGDHFQAA